MTQLRAHKVAEQMKKDVSEILRDKVKDPRVGFVTVTGVEVSTDLRHAKIFVSILGSNEEKALTLEALERATSFVRREIGKLLPLRYTPEIAFREDASIAHGARIAELLNQVRGEDNQT